MSPIILDDRRLLKCGGLKVWICSFFERAKIGCDRVISVRETVIFAAGRVCSPAVFTTCMSELTLSAIEITQSATELTLTVIELTQSVTELTLSFIKMTVTRQKIPGLKG